MRSKTYEPSYYTNRAIHITIGLILWVSTKAKVYIICMVEDQTEKLKFDIHTIAIVYFSIVLGTRIVLEIFIRGNLFDDFFRSNFLSQVQHFSA
jgi:hypothetical protein